MKAVVAMLSILGVYLLATENGKGNQGTIGMTGVIAIVWLFEMIKIWAEGRK